MKKKEKKDYSPSTGRKTLNLKDSKERTKDLKSS